MHFVNVTNILDSSCIGIIRISKGKEKIVYYLCLYILPICVDGTLLNFTIAQQQQKE